MARKKETEKDKEKAEASHWTDAQDAFFVQLLLEEKEAGNMSENSFKQSTFNGIADKLEEAYPATQGAIKTGAAIGHRWQKVSSVIYL